MRRRFSVPATPSDTPAIASSNKPADNQTAQAPKRDRFFMLWFSRSGLRRLSSVAGDEARLRQQQAGPGPVECGKGPRRAT